MKRPQHNKYGRCRHLRRLRSLEWHMKVCWVSLAKLQMNQPHPLLEAINAKT